VPDSPDWFFGTGSFTIDFWIRLNTFSTGEQVIQQYASAGNWWRLFIYPSGGTRYWIFQEYVGGTITIDIRGTSPGVTTGTCDIYALVVGDMNTSFNPAQGAKGIASETLLLTYGETRKADPGEEVKLPLRILDASELTAASLILNYPEDLFEVTGVGLKLESGNLDWMAKGGELRAGWNSLNPQWLEAGSVLMTIHGRVSALFGEGDEIRFTLAPDLLNELAEGNNNVIPDAKLGIDVLAFSTSGTWNPEPGTWNGLTLQSHPNPFSGYSKLDYRLPKEGNVTLEITDMLGRRVVLLVDQRQDEGEHTVKLDATPLQPGVYMARLRLDFPEGYLVKTIKLVRNW
jgi:hypothetical protein